MPTIRDNRGGATLDLFGARVFLLPLARVPVRYAGLDEYGLRAELSLLVKELTLDEVVDLALYLESDAFKSARARSVSASPANSRA